MFSDVMDPPVKYPSLRSIVLTGGTLEGGRRIPSERRAMKLALSQKWIEKMKSLPETGMGYHKVKIVLKDKTVINALVFNSEIVDTNISFSNDDIADISAS